MAVAKKERELVTFKANNCEIFSVSIQIAEKYFFRKSFIDALPFEVLAKAFKQQQYLTVSCNRQNKKIDYRAVVDIHPENGKPKTQKLHFHVSLMPTTSGTTKEEQPPYAEEIFRWLCQFIDPKAPIELWEQAEFAFPLTAYRSVFSLPTQLVGPTNPTENEPFEGSQMIGVSIDLQGNNNKAGVSFAEQRIFKKSIGVRLVRKTTSNVQKLMTIEKDIIVLKEVAFLTVRPRRRKK